MKRLLVPPLLLLIAGGCVLRPQRTPVQVREGEPRSDAEEPAAPVVPPYRGAAATPDRSAPPLAYDRETRGRLDRLLTGSVPAPPTPTVVVLPFPAPPELGGDLDPALLVRALAGRLEARFTLVAPGAGAGALELGTDELALALVESGADFVLVGDVARGEGGPDADLRFRYELVDLDAAATICGAAATRAPGGADGEPRALADALVAWIADELEACLGTPRDGADEAPENPPAPVRNER